MSALASLNNFWSGFAAGVIALGFIVAIGRELTKQRRYEKRQAERVEKTKWNTGNRLLKALQATAQEKYGSYMVQGRCSRGDPYMISVHLCAGDETNTPLFDVWIRLKKNSRCDLEIGYIIYVTSPSTRKFLDLSNSNIESILTDLQAFLRNYQPSVDITV